MECVGDSAACSRLHRSNRQALLLTLAAGRCCAQDPWQMHNMHDNSIGHLPTAAEAALHTELHTWYHCQGDACP